MEDYHDKYALLIFKELTNKLLFSKNSVSFLKYLLFRRDERLRFLITRFLNNSLTPEKLIDALDELVEKESSRCFNALFANHSLEVGKKISKEERQQKSLNYTNLTYGEIDFVSFRSILSKCCRGKNFKVFYDLGSGTGRAVVTARLTQDFDRCEGIELLESLFNASTQILDEYKQSWNHTIRFNSSDTVIFHHESILERNWSDGDLIFANSTCFDASLMRSLSEQSESLKPGSIFISFTKSLTSDQFEMIEKTRYMMSWGPATVYIHQRLNYDGTSTGRNQDGGPFQRFMFESYRHPTQSSAVHAEIRRQNYDPEGKDAAAAAADISEISSATPSSLLPGHHTEFQFTIPVKSNSSLKSKAMILKSIKCLVYAPKHYNESNFDSLPLVVFLHGASARGADFSNLKQTGLPAILSNENSSNCTRSVETQPESVGIDLSALVLSPLCPAGLEWKSADVCAMVSALIDATVTSFSADKRRIYLTGISMGGLGSWMLAARYPTKFAAVVPMCGGGSPVYARLLKDVPIWFVHSADDNVIDVAETDRLVAALQKEGATEVKYTRLDQCPLPAAQEWMIGHNCWDKAYRESELWAWLLGKESPQDDG